MSGKPVAGPSSIHPGKLRRKKGIKRRSTSITTGKQPMKRVGRGEIVPVNDLSDETLKNVLQCLSSDEEFSDSSEGSDISGSSLEGIVNLESEEVYGIPAVPLGHLHPKTLEETATAAGPTRTPITWRNTPPTVPSIPFTGKPGLKVIPETQTPFAYFSMLANEKFYNLVLTETENFAEHLFLENPSESGRITAWKPLTREEFQVWLGLLYHMGHIRISRMESYWRTDKLYRIPIFAEHMSRDRFLGIMQALHFAKNPGKNDPAPSDRLHKIRPLIDLFHETMVSIFSPEKNLLLEESMVLWRGRLICRQYIKGKKKKFGIKIYMLTEPTGLVLRVIVYARAGDGDVGGKGHAAKVVKTLMKDFTNKGHSIYMDSFYNSVHLSQDLLKDKTYSTGALRRNRKKNPMLIVEKRLSPNEIVSQWSEDGLCVMKWRDRREVLLTSTEFGPEMVEVPGKRCLLQKPKAVAEYNKCMGGVDHFEQLMAYYSCEYRSIKWYKKLGIHFFQVMLLNSYFLYSQFSGHKKNWHDYRHEVVDSLLSAKSHHSPHRNIDFTHFPRMTAFSESGKKHRIQKRCRLCHQNNIKKMVIYICPGCKDEPGLCLEPCFIQYHSL